MRLEIFSYVVFLLRLVWESIDFSVALWKRREWEKRSGATLAFQMFAHQSQRRAKCQLAGLLGSSDAGDEQDGQAPEQLINEDCQGAKLSKRGAAGKEGNQHKA